MDIIPCVECGELSYRDHLCRKHFLIRAWSVNLSLDQLGIVLFFQKVIPKAFKNFKYGVPRFFREIIWEALQDRPEWTWNDRKIVIAAPRGSSKTTLLSKGYALYCAIFRKKRYIVLASKTGRAAEKNLRWIRNTLGSSAIISMFGDLRPDVHGKRLDVDEVEGIWSKSIIVLKNGVTIEAVGMGQQLRSAAEGEEANRIDLLIADDTETDENTKTPDRRESNEVWLFETVLPSLDFDTGTVIFINTLTHTESILAKLLKAPEAAGWRKKLYQIDWVDEDGVRQYLWPEKFPPVTVEKIRLQYEAIGRLGSFYKEYHNIIRSEKGFNDRWIKYYHGECFNEGGRNWMLFDGQTELAYLTLGIDLSASYKEKADYTVLLPLATIHDNRRFILPYQRGRFATYDDFAEGGTLIRKGVISEALRLHEKYHFDKIVMDATGNQLATFNQLAKEFSSFEHPPQIIPYRAVGEKFQRLRDLLEPEYQLGRIHHLRGMDDIMRELVSFGDTTDDILDALFNAIKYASAPGRMQYEKTLMDVKRERLIKNRERTVNWMTL